MVYMFNILRWYTIGENVDGFYSYYRRVGVTVSGTDAAPMVFSITSLCTITCTYNAFHFGTEKCTHGIFTL